MDREETNTDQPKPKWFIDLDWYQQNSRSFLTLAQHCLCPKCSKKLKIEEGKTTPAELISIIKDCCSKTPRFITDKLPIMESIFRFFLANGNQPLDLGELGKQLSKWRGGDTYCTSAEILSRLLRNDQYYGLGQVPEPAEPEVPELTEPDSEP